MEIMNWKEDVCFEKHAEFSDMRLSPQDVLILARLLRHGKRSLLVWLLLILRRNQRKQRALESSPILRLEFGLISDARAIERWRLFDLQLA